jgi:hypothetical protein
MQMIYLFLAGLFLTVVSWFALSQIIADRRGLAYGLSIFALPPLAIYYTTLYWKSARKILAAFICGILVSGAALGLGGWSESIDFLAANGFETEAQTLTHIADKSYFYLYGYRHTTNNQTGQDALTDAPEKTQQATAQSQTASSTSAATPDTTITPSARTTPALVSVPRYRSHNPQAANQFLGYQVKVRLNNGTEREAILVSNDDASLTLKEMTRTGYFAYDVPVNEIRAFYVKVATRRSV